MKVYKSFMKASLLISNLKECFDSSIGSFEDEDVASIDDLLCFFGEFVGGGVANPSVSNISMFRSSAPSAYSLKLALLVDLPDLLNS